MLPADIDIRMSPLYNPTNVGKPVKDQLMNFYHIIYGFKSCATTMGCREKVDSGFFTRPSILSIKWAYGLIFASCVYVPNAGTTLV